MSKTKWEKWKSVNLATLNNEQLKEAVDAMARTANQRLRQLEKSGVQKTSLAYVALEKQFKEKQRAKAEGGEDIYTYFTTTKKGQIKFRTDLVNRKTHESRTNQDLEKEAGRLRKFLSTKTSEVAKVRQYVKDAKKTYEKVIDRELTESEFEDIWDEDLLQNYYSLYGSGEFNALMAVSVDRKLTSKQIASILSSAGLTEESTEKNKPTLQQIEQAFEDWDNLSKRG